MNAQNALNSKTQKWNGEVLFMQIYEDFGQYNGKMAVIGGHEITGEYEGWYDTFFVIDNSPNGPDECSYYIFITPDYTEAQGYWNMAPEDLVTFLYGTLPTEGGHLMVY